MPQYWKHFPDIQNQLDDVCTMIATRTAIRNTDISQAIVQLSQAGGKYLRPAFFFLFASLGSLQQPQQQSKQEDLIKIATSLEILHMATLIHDDVIDDSPLRRNQPTIQTTFGKDVAVYTGDFLFTVFFELILETMEGSPFMAINAKAMKKILVGELDQMALYYNQAQTIQDYLRAISGKTAALFKLACQEGAYFGGSDARTVHLAGRIGYAIGMTFQILDDILDYTASPKDFTKPVLEDVRNGVYSLPLLLALREKASQIQPLLDKKAAITDTELKQLAKLVKQAKGIDKARSLANRFTQKALADIERLPDSKRRKELLSLTKHLLSRQV